MFMLVRADVLRRSSSQRPEYYEAYAAIFMVSTRTGRLVDWRLQSYEAASADEANKKLTAAIPDAAKDLQRSIVSKYSQELNEAPPPQIPEPPVPGSPEASAIRSPLPYRRVKPDYTPEASLYGIAATVEITVDLDADGRIIRTEITRWAGFGLDRSVETAVRGMNWRPADRNGKPMPMRFTLQYNFRKPDKN
jgi:TonB family protein